MHEILEDDAAAAPMLWHMSEEQFFMFISSVQLGKPIGFGPPPVDAKLPAWWVTNSASEIAAGNHGEEYAREHEEVFMDSLLFGKKGKTWEEIVRLR
jgi:hypothetical protein